MKKNNKRKGIWIPIEMIENKDLDWTNKALLSEIYSLHNQEKGCIASDQHFANLLGFKYPSTAQKRVDTLVDLKLIRKEVITKDRKIIGKILTPLHPISSIGKITSQKNSSTVQKGQNNSSNENNGVVPGRLESSSSGSSLVVPGIQVSTSHKNTNNTEKNTIKNNTSINTTGPIQDIDEIGDVSNSSAGDFNNISAKDIPRSERHIEILNKASELFKDHLNWQQEIEEMGTRSFIKKYSQIYGANEEFYDLVKDYYNKIYMGFGD